MTIKIKNTKDIDATSVKCVVYGGAGVGKTRFCATAPKPIIISAESGLLSLASQNVDYIEINTLDDLNAAYKELKKSTDYDTICLDSLSEIAEQLMEQYLPKHKDKRQAYGEMAMDMIPMLRKFRDIQGKNTIFTTKLIRVHDEETEKTTEELFLPGKVLPNQVPYMVDELFCLRPDRKGTILQTKPDRMRFCKDRSGALEGEMLYPAGKEPNAAELFEKIKAANAK